MRTMQTTSGGSQVKYIASFRGSVWLPLNDVPWRWGLWLGGSSSARSIGSDWDVGVEYLWYNGLYRVAERALDVIKRCGLPRAVFAEAESDFERDDNEFQGLDGMCDGDGDD